MIRYGAYYLFMNLILDKISKICTAKGIRRTILNIFQFLLVLYTNV